jgi:hypothetical protein
LAREPVVLIIGLAGQAPSRRSRLSSNVWRHDQPVKLLYFMTFTARPDTDAEDLRRTGVAYVNAWVEASSEADAVARATRQIAEAQWIVESVDRIIRLSRNDYETSDPALSYFDQALIDGEVFVFHTWSPGSQEDDPVH